MQNFTTFNLRQLRNKEVPMYAKRVYNAITRHDPAVLHILGMYLQLSEAITSLELKIVYNKKLELTTVIAQDRSDIIRILGAIMDLARAIKRGRIQAQAGDLAIVQAFIDNYMVSIKEEAEVSLLSQLGDLFLMHDGDLVLKAAIEGLSMKPLFDELKVGYTSLVNDSDNRTQVRARRKLDNFKGVRRTTEKALRNLLLAIELAIVEYPALDYSLLVADINNIIIEQKALVDSRNTRRENQLKEEEENQTISKTLLMKVEPPISETKKEDLSTEATA